MSFIDPSRAPRAGEELDLKVVRDFLGANIPGIDGDFVIEQFPSGYSNLTYLLRVGDMEMVLRRPPFGAKNIKAGHDMHREFRILSKLHLVYPPAPKPLAYTEDESIMGCPFYIMERKKGIILRKKPPKGLELSADTMRKISEATVDNLAAIHKIDYNEIGLGDFGKPDGFLKRQVEGWADRYERAQTDDIPEAYQAIKWCKENIPDSPPATLIHNDYKFDNLVLDPNDPTKIIGVLDWEMSTIGDPLLDLGVMLSYWVQKNDPPDIQLSSTLCTNMDGVLTRRMVVDRYAEKSGREISNLPFYFAFALFKLSVIAQQIYYRFAKGFTKDERFKLLLPGVIILNRSAVKVIEKQTLDFN